jgi:hypothetical protein
LRFFLETSSENFIVSPGWTSGDDDGDEAYFMAPRRVYPAPYMW